MFVSSSGVFSRFDDLSGGAALVVLYVPPNFIFGGTSSTAQRGLEQARVTLGASTSSSVLAGCSQGQPINLGGYLFHQRTYMGASGPGVDCGAGTCQDVYLYSMLDGQNCYAVEIRLFITNDFPGAALSAAEFTQIRRSIIGNLKFSFD